MRLSSDEALRRAVSADHGVLGTLRDGQGPDLVPVCFAVDGNQLAVPVDRVKPKDAADLQRIRNLLADNRATLLVERWDPADWSRLWWVRLRLEASAAASAQGARFAELLRARYPQYRATPFERLLTFRIVDVKGWAATSIPDRSWPA